MKIAHLAAATGVAALIGGGAWAQAPAAKPAQPVNPTPPEAAAPAAPTGQAVSSSTTTTDASGASFTTTLTTNGPVPDTPANRAKYGGPMSHAGKHTAAKGN